MKGKDHSYKGEKLIVNLTKSSLIVRLVFIGLGLAIACLSFYSVFSRVLRTQSGWQSVPSGSTKTPAGQEFSLMYEIGVSGRSPSEEWVKLNKRYPTLLDEAYKIFSTKPYDGVSNLTVLNGHPNEPVTVEPALYGALQQMKAAGSRYLFYAPIFEQYHGLLGCENDWDAANFDPVLNEDVAAFVRAVVAFAADDQSIDVEFGEPYTVTLRVSQEYQAFAAEHEVSDYIDLSYLRNGFVIDYVADRLMEEGYTAGVLSCREGYTRALGGGAYSLNLFAKMENTVKQVGAMTYSGAMSLVPFRSYPLGDADGTNYYVYADGRVVHPFLDLNTGLCAVAMPELVTFSRQGGCAELLMNSWNGFVSGVPTLEALNRLGVETVVCTKDGVFCSDPDINIKY